MGWLSWSARTLTSAESSQLESEKRDCSIQNINCHGGCRGAGSSAPALVTLFGEDGSSESYMLGGNKSESFDRATRAQYVLYSKFLGSLRRILIQQLPSSCDNDEDDSKGWYLDRIEVHGPDGERYTFPCSSWFGCNLVGEETCTERNLIVAADHRDTHRSSLHDPAHRLTQPLLVDASGYSMPHPDKVRAGTKGMNRKGMGYGGEDAYFYASNSNGIWAVGVADGVYEWRQVGIDAGAFSRQLMEYCRQAIELGTMDVLRVLQFASKHLRRCETLGSSTVCLGIVDTLQGRLATATIGDSGFILLGRSRENYMSSTLQGTYYIRYRSPQQEHSFGCPYQLGHQEGADNPEDAMLSTMPLYPGDVLIIGSDGLFDNVADESIVEMVNKVLAEGGKPNELSQALAFHAFQTSTDKAAMTPYSVAASEAFEMIYNGGKADDITVVTAVFN
eukprot:jgi/Picre1/28870/NNA_004266.t1